MLTENETKLFVALCKYIDMDHDNNPDVGMGLSTKMVVEEAEKVAGIKLADDDKKVLDDKLFEWRKKYQR